MNWHETIQAIRQNPDFSDLVRLAYFDENLSLNVKRFGASEEFKETIKIINQYAPKAKSVLDIGAGNGISSVNFALNGYLVTAVEPDPSDTVGANAIRRLQKDFNLNNLVVYENFAEQIGFESNTFDLVYVRQAMHHAYELKKFISECARVLRPGGILLTIRDHVVYNSKDKEWFLQSHPLHKFYGGENAFTANEYKEEMIRAGLSVVREIKFYDSVINFFPITHKQINDQVKEKRENLKRSLKKKIGLLAKLPMVFDLYRLKNGVLDSFLDEAEVAGRMYSYIAQKAR